MERITVKKVNDIDIKPMKAPIAEDKRLPKHYKLCGEPYCNIYIIARKKSGKTVIIQNIIKQAAGKDTTVFAFCPTIHKDPNWVAIRRWCEKHGINFKGYLDVRTDKGNDALKEIINALQDEGDEEELEEEYEEMKHGGRHKMASNDKDRKRYLNMFGTGDDDESEDDSGSYSEEEDLFKANKAPGPMQKVVFDSRKKQSVVEKQPYKTPEYIFIFDDLSHVLRIPSVTALTKKNRHFKSVCVYSSQSWEDTLPESRKQMDLVLLFKGQDRKKLEKILKDCDLDISLDTFEKIYQDATKEKFGFLYIDVRNCLYRKNFDRQYVIEIAPKPKYTEVKQEDLSE